jgi:hypothetical protein
MEDEDIAQNCFWTVTPKTNIRHVTVSVTKKTHSRLTTQSLDVVHLQSKSALGVLVEYVTIKLAL